MLNPVNYQCNGIEAAACFNNIFHTNFLLKFPVSLVVCEWSKIVSQTIGKASSFNPVIVANTVDINETQNWFKSHFLRIYAVRFCLATIKISRAKKRIGLEKSFRKLCISGIGKISQKIPLRHSKLVWKFSWKLALVKTAAFFKMVS